MKKNMAAKAKAAGKAAAKSVAPTAAPAAGEAAPKAEVAVAAKQVLAKAAASKSSTPPTQPASAQEAQTAIKRSTTDASQDSAEGSDPKKPRTEDQETLGKMLVQGVVRVLQNRQKANGGPLPVDDLEEEFKALWKVPFNLQQAGETDVVSFLKRWPNKVEVVTGSDSKTVVILANKKNAEKGKGPPPKPANGAAVAKPGGTPASKPAKAITTSPAAVRPKEPAQALARKEAPASAPARQDGATGTADGGELEGAALATMPEVRNQAASLLARMRE